MNPLAARRARAYALDCAGYLGVAAATVPLGLVVRRLAHGNPSRTLVLGLSALPPVIATVWAALAESGPQGATIGKRRAGLVVVPATSDGREPITMRQAMVRSVVKILVPWQLGHMVAIGAATGGFDDNDALTIGATIVTYPLLGLFAWMVLHGDGRGPHDRVAGTRVVSVPTDR